MRTKPLRFIFTIILWAALFQAIFYLPLWAKGKVKSFDVTIRISQVEKTLNVLDEMVGSDTGQAGQSPTLLLRGMLQGTEWIDPSRLIVIGINFGDAVPDMVALIPFRQANENFKSMFNAQAGPDYYLLPLPPGGEPRPILPAEKTFLEAAAKSKARASVSAEIPFQKMLQGKKEEIRTKIMTMGELPQQQTGPNFNLTQKDLQDMMLKMVDMAGQLKHLAINLDLKSDRLTFGCVATPAAGSQLAKLVRPGGKTTMLSNYKPRQQITFRCRSYDFKGLFKLVNDIFGNMYAKLGINFSELSEIVYHFTGEMVGGISYGKGGAAFEAVCVLKGKQKSEVFLEKVYMPWILKYGRSMADMFENHLGEKVAPIYARTKDSKVAGLKVIGIKTNFPALPAAKDMQATMDLNALMASEMRMAAVGNMMVIAPNDKRVAQLIQVAKKGKPKRAPGPMIDVDLDMGAYLNAFKQMIPELSATTSALPKTNLKMTGDLKNGQAVFNYSVKTRDFKNLMAYFQQMQMAGTTGAGAARQTTRPKAASTKKAEVKKKILPRNTAAYWIDRGGLCSAYGGYKAAIGHFHRAIKIDPMNAGAHFRLGVAYGETGKYEKGLQQIDKAIELDSENDKYYYGRGRVHLLAGDRQKAAQDFEKAASMGNMDAKYYLDKIVTRSSN